MKLSKKLMALLVAGTMSVSAFALAACDNLPGDNGGKPGDNTGDNGNNGGDSGNNGGNGGNGGTVTEQDKLINSLKEISFSGIDASINLSEDYVGQNYSHKMTANQSVKVDLKSGNADIKINETEESTNDGQTHKSADDINFYIRNWNLLSEEYAYDEATGSSKATGNLLYGGNLKDMAADLELPEGVDLIIGEKNLVDFAVENSPAVLGETLSIVTAIANAADAVTVTDTKATVNINLMAYNMASDIKNLVNGVTVTTTVNDILSSNYLKKYLMVFTEMIPVETVQQGLASLKDVNLGELFAGINASQGGQIPEEVIAVLSEVDLSKVAAIKPDANSTTYDYILKILGSEELCTLLKTTIADLMGAGAPAALAADDATPAGPDMEAIMGEIDKITSLTAIPVSFVGLCMGLSAEQLTEILDGAKQMVATVADTYVSKDSFTLPLGGEGHQGSPDYDGSNGEEGGSSSSDSYTVEYSVTVSDAKIEYTLASGKVTGLSASAKYNAKSDYKYEDASKDHVETETGSVDTSIKFATDLTFENIDSKKVFESRTSGVLQKTEGTKPVATTNVVYYDTISNDLVVKTDKGVVLGSTQIPVSAYGDNGYYREYEGKEYRVALYSVMDSYQLMVVDVAAEKAVYSATLSSAMYENTVGGLVKGEAWTEVKA